MPPRPSFAARREFGEQQADAARGVEPCCWVRGGIPRVGTTRLLVSDRSRELPLPAGWNRVWFASERGILRGGLTVNVSGRPEKLDVFEKEYTELLYARAEQLMERDLRDRHR